MKIGYTIKYTQEYLKHNDITVIFKAIYNKEDIVSIEISGFYYGEPDLKGLETFKDSGTKLSLIH